MGSGLWGGGVDESKRAVGRTMKADEQGKKIEATTHHRKATKKPNQDPQTQKTWTNSYLFTPLIFYYSCFHRFLLLLLLLLLLVRQFFHQLGRLGRGREGARHHLFLEEIRLHQKANAPQHQPRLLLHLHPQ